MVAQSTTQFRKVVAFDQDEKDAISWLTAHGFGKNCTDAVRKAVVLARLVREGPA